MLRPAEGKSRPDPGVLTLIAAGMCGVTGCARSAVFLLDLERAVLEGGGAHGFVLEDVTAIDLGDVPLAAAAIEAGSPVRCEDALGEGCLPRSWIEGLRLTAAAFVPLVSGGAPLALVLLDCADTSTEVWPEVEQRAVAFANVVAVALDADLAGTQPVDQRETADQASVPEPEQPRLSDQELKVLSFAADGLTNPEIGARLGLSRHTVKEYLSHAMRKLKAANRIEAVQKASSLGLLEASGTGEGGRAEHEWKLVYDQGEAPVETSDLKVPPIKIGRLRVERRP
jgi:DNA-binding CsgD family transcriptional regulator